MKATEQQLVDLVHATAGDTLHPLDAEERATVYSVVDELRRLRGAHEALRGAHEVLIKSYNDVTDAHTRTIERARKLDQELRDLHLAMAGHR